MERTQVVARIAAAIEAFRQVIVAAPIAPQHETRHVDDRFRDAAQIVEERKLVEQIARVVAARDVVEIALQERVVALLQQGEDGRVEALARRQRHAEQAARDAERQREAVVLRPIAQAIERGAQPAGHTVAIADRKTCRRGHILNCAFAALSRN